MNHFADLLFLFLYNNHYKYFFFDWLCEYLNLRGKIHFCNEIYNFDRKELEDLIKCL
jgi:hypothetical protein